MLCRHVFGKISSEFRGILRVFVNFADLLEIRGSATARNIRSPALRLNLEVDPLRWKFSVFKSCWKLNSFRLSYQQVKLISGFAISHFLLFNHKLSFDNNKFIICKK